MNKLIASIAAAAAIAVATPALAGGWGNPHNGPQDCGCNDYELTAANEGFVAGAQGNLGLGIKNDFSQSVGGAIASGEGGKFTADALNEGVVVGLQANVLAGYKNAASQSVIGAGAFGTD